jgi:hypothetical protein
LDAGLAAVTPSAVVVGFFVVAMDPAYHPVRRTWDRQNAGDHPVNRMSTGVHTTGLAAVFRRSSPSTVEVRRPSPPAPELHAAAFAFQALQDFVARFAIHRFRFSSGRSFLELARVDDHLQVIIRTSVLFCRIPRDHREVECRQPIAEFVAMM